MSIPRSFRQFRARVIRDAQEVFDAEYVKPEGKSLAVIRIVGKSKNIRATAFQTFDPGSRVTAVKGPTGWTLLPPAPQAGGASSAAPVAFRRRIAGSQETAPVAVWYAVRLRNSDDTWFVSRHEADGTWIGDFGAPVYFGVPGDDNFAAGPFASSGLFAEGWFILLRFDESVLTACHPATEASYTYNVPSGKKASPAYLISDRLYWIEMDVNEPPSGCVKPNPIRLRSALPDLTDVQTESSDSIAGLDASDCHWDFVSNDSYQAGTNIGVRIFVENGATPTPAQTFQNWNGYSSVTGTPALEESSLLFPGEPGTVIEPSQDLDGTRAIAIIGGGGNKPHIRDATDIEDQWTEWENVAGLAVLIPPTQGAVYVMTNDDPVSLNQYNAVAASPVLQNTITLDSHPTIASIAWTVWRVGG